MNKYTVTVRGNGHELKDVIEADSPMRALAIAKEKPSLVQILDELFEMKQGDKLVWEVEEDFI